jgi:hypothetical protein
VEPPRLSEPAPEPPRFGHLLTKITDRVRDGLRPAAAMIRATRTSIDVRIGEDEPAEGLPRIASTLAASMRKPENQRAARYIGAAVLTLAVTGSAYGILASGGTDTSVAAPQTRLATTEVHQEAPVRPPIGAVQQGDATLPEASTAKPATRNTESRPAESTKERSSSATSSLPTIKKLNVSAPVDAGQELVPVEVVLDLRTQLSNGRQQADAGQYALARRILASAMTSAGTAVNKYSGSKTLRSIRAELDSADRRVLGACQAENEMLKKRGGTAVPCN